MNKKQSGKSSTVARRSISGWVIGGIAAVVVVIFAVIAIVSTGDEPSSESGVSETRPVEVTGTPLVTFDAATSPDPAVGVVAPTLAGQEFDGTPIAVKPGRPTLVVVLAHWCSHCQAEVPVLTQWEAAGGVPEGADVIGVASGTDSAAPNYPPSQWLADEQFPFPVMADSDGSDAAIAYGLSGYPYFVLLDADGEVVQRGSGEFDPATLTPVLESLVAA